MARQLKQHRMQYTTRVAKTAATAVTHFLQSYWMHTVTVHNVEDDPVYQQYDIDLLWTILEKNGRLRIIPVEIKGDRYHHTGNFFFETVSNASKGTPGCFLYTKADWLFYFFVKIGMLYCLPMTAVRAWFVSEGGRFKEQRTSTPVGVGEHYITVGRLVPITVVMAEVPGIMQFEKKAQGWERLH